MPRPKGSKNKETKTNNVSRSAERMYFHNGTDVVVEVGDIVFEPDDVRSVPPELVKEAQEKLG